MFDPVTIGLLVEGAVAGLAGLTNAWNTLQRGEELTPAQMDAIRAEQYAADGRRRAANDAAAAREAAAAARPARPERKLSELRQQPDDIGEAENDEERPPGASLA